MKTNSGVSDQGSKNYWTKQTQKDVLHWHPNHMSYYFSSMKRLLADMHENILLFDKEAEGLGSNFHLSKSFHQLPDPSPGVARHVIIFGF